jgi:protein involved in polysaccharide export with SLBB domain
MKMQGRLDGRCSGWMAVLTAVVALAGCGGGQRSAATAPSGMPVAALMPPSPPTAGPEYRIQSGDELHVRFLYQPDMNEQIPVRPDGRITLASTGEIEAVVLTPKELEALVVQKSSSRLRDPEVTVIVT